MTKFRRILCLLGITMLLLVATAVVEDKDGQLGRKPTLRQRILPQPRLYASPAARPRVPLPTPPTNEYLRLIAGRNHHDKANSCPPFCNVGNVGFHSE